jgi:translation elongation factor aEF-1 beta
MRILPVNVNTPLELLETKLRKVLESFIENKESRSEKQPIAFGLNALNFVFFMDENKNLEMLENKLKTVEGVRSVDVIDVRRAIG